MFHVNQEQKSRAHTHTQKSQSGGQSIQNMPPHPKNTLERKPSWVRAGSTFQTPHFTILGFPAARSNPPTEPLPPQAPHPCLPHPPNTVNFTAPRKTLSFLIRRPRLQRPQLEKPDVRNTASTRRVDNPKGSK